MTPLEVDIILHARELARLSLPRKTEEEISAFARRILAFVKEDCSSSSFSKNKRQNILASAPTKLVVTKNGETGPFQEKPPTVLGTGSPVLDRASDHKKIIEAVDQGRVTKCPTRWAAGATFSSNYGGRYL